jgi:acylglycerol lipase
MTTETDFLIGQDGNKLFYRSWNPENAKYVLCIIHGHGEHSLRYKDLAHHLCENNIAVFASDLRGHGESYGKRGHCPSYDYFMAEIEELLKVAREQFTDLPLFLMGHSMGGNLVANWMIQNTSNEITGYILSSPWFKLAFDPDPIKLKLGKIMNRIWPSYTEENGLALDKLSRDPAIVTSYDEDKLVHGKISARLFHDITEAAERAIKNASKIKTPGLVYHGDADQIIDYRGTEAFVQQNENVKWMLLPGVYHEPHNDLGKELVYEMLVNWISKINI